MILMVVKGHKMSIRRQMIVLVTCFLLSPMLLFTYFFNHYLVQEVRQAVEVSVENSLILTEMNLDNLRINIINACISVSIDSEAGEYLEMNMDKTDFLKNIFAKKIEKMATINLASADNYGAIIGLNGETFNLYHGIANPLAQDFLQHPEQYRKINWFMMNTFDSAGTPFIVCTCPIYKNNTSVPDGISVVAVAQDGFQAIINRSRNYNTYEAIIVDKDDRILSHQNKAYIGKHINEIIRLEESSQGGTLASNLLTGGEFVYFDKAITIGDSWRTITLISYDEVFSGIDRITRLNNSVLLLLSVGTLAGVAMISKTITRPIVKLSNYMEAYPQNQGKLVKEEISSQEADSLYDSYTHQMETIDKLILKIESDKEAFNDLQFKTLQSQINPHFLFNTLNNIKMSAFLSGSKDVGYMIAELGKLLEVSIYFNSAMVSIGEELDYVTSYIRLQNIHFQGSLVLENRIPEELYFYQIIKFTLQPILENSIRHGFVRQHETHRILLLGEEREDRIIITVRDNGQGFSEEKLKEALHKLSAKEETGRVGLYNINERIKLTFGENYGLRINSREGEYTEVIVEIGKIRGEETC